MANISSDPSTWSGTEASNQPDTTDSNTIVADMRAIQAAVKKYLLTSASVASGTTVDLSAVAALFAIITHSTGTTAISAFGTVAAGMWKFVRISISGGVLTLTHNGTSMICPEAKNLFLINGDSFVAESLGSGNWRIHNFSKLSLPAFSASVNAATNMVQNTFVKMEFNAEDFDTNANYDPSTARFTCTDPGTYHIDLLATLSAISNQKNWTVAVYKNGVVFKQNGGVINGSGSAAEIASDLSFNMTLVATDYIEAYGFNSDVDQVLSTNNAKSHFSAYKLF